MLGDVSAVSYKIYSRKAQMCSIKVWATRDAISGYCSHLQTDNTYDGTQEYELVHCVHESITKVLDQKIILYIL